MKRFLIVLAGLGAVAIAQVTVLNRTANWPPYSGASYSLGGPYEVAYQAVPTSLTAIDTRSSHFIGYCVSNSSGGALTFTIQTKDGSPLPLPITGSIPALGSPGSSVCFNAPFGLLSTGGFSVQASGAGLYWAAAWTH